MTAKLTPSQLLELASLDAIGALDEDEAAAFEAGFAAASEDTQAAIRREQARTWDNLDWLPDIAPSAELRPRVLDAIAGQIAGNAPAVRTHAATAGTSERTETRHRARPRSNRVSGLWRGVAVGLAGASVVLGLGFWQMQQTYHSLNHQIASEQIVPELSQFISPQLATSVMRDPSWVRVALAESDDADAVGVFWLHPERPDVIISATLPPAMEGERLIVAVVEGQNELGERLGSIEANAALTVAALQTELDLAGQRIGIFAEMADGSVRLVASARIA
ncbi:MAG: hypothetical protein AAF747_01350 [Planctomycetota bacterium]